MVKVPLGWSRSFMAEVLAPYSKPGEPCRATFYAAIDCIIRATIHTLNRETIEYELTLPVGRN
jgi:hypothetical protein